MVKLPAIALSLGLLIASSVAVDTGIPQPKQSPTPKTAQCQTLTSFSESPIQTLPPPFENGCAISTPLRANNPGTIIYVLKTGMRSPVVQPSRDDLTVQQTETLDRLVDRGEAVRITWFSPATLGSQQFVEALPPETVFLAWNDLCTKFSAQKVGCVESGLFRPSALAEILIKNKERAAIQP
ncbi:MULTISPECIES: hypothetical protein [Trichocoleus]|uniref:Uncharacterized protein n=1 Tax=Trichocoleus desertorum GB2-A4 TaxID=2933944 RepID=A0ABV0JBT7_9CYAN|nr:hypothetical protein [Trichocoleus sp. FACHB-46]MBD1865378.1 hypothetical protein [Trichocoleus sp. FACHB-46]